MKNFDQLLPVLLEQNGQFKKAAFTRQTKVGKLVLANSSWFV